MENQVPSEDYLRYREEEIGALKQKLSLLPAGDYILELGCGHGHFLTALAEKLTADGEKFCYAGVDKNPDRIERAQKKSDRMNLPISWFNARIEDVLTLWPTSHKIDKTFVLFPDPWPKARHHKNRFVNAELLQSLAKTSKKGAHFYFRTDHDGYFEAINELISSQNQWKINVQETWPVGLPATVFEGHHPRYQSLIATLSS